LSRLIGPKPKGPSSFTQLAALALRRLILPRAPRDQNTPQQIIPSSRTTTPIFNFIFVEGCGKTTVLQVVYNSICLKYTGGPLIERRRAKRFQVDWQIRVEGAACSEGSFIESGMLRNISSGGALLALTNPPATGTQLDVYIKLPLKAKKWMKYPARVVRIELGAGAVAAAVKFDSSRPDFGIPM
jgi:hypothetical protein